MSEGQGNISYNDPSGGAVPPFQNIAGGRNGLSLDGDQYVVLGNDEGESGQPAKLLSNRQISLLAFFIELLRETSGVIRISQDGFVINQAFPNAVSMKDNGFTIGTVETASVASGSQIGILSNSTGCAIALALMPADFAEEGAMIFVGQPEALATMFLMFYATGGVGLGQQDFGNGSGTDLAGFMVDGFVLNQKLVTVETAPTTLSNRFDTGKVYTNSGASALVVLQLPEANTLNQSGYFDFYVDEAIGIQIVAGVSDTIRIGASVSAAGGTATAVTQGNALRLLLLNPGGANPQWVAQSFVGAWVVV
jgi:hypothetical protein